MARMMICDPAAGTILLHPDMPLPRHRIIQNKMPVWERTQHKKNDWKYMDQRFQTLPVRENEVEPFTWKRMKLPKQRGRNGDGSG